MEKTRGAQSFRPRVRQGPSSPAAGPFLAAASSSAADIAAANPTTAVGPVAADPSVAAIDAGPSAPAVRPTSAPVAAVPAKDAEGSSSVAPAQRRYHTRVGPTPPAHSHPRPARRAPPAKRARTSGSGESSTLRSRASPSPPYQAIVGAPDLSPGSIIRRPYFPSTPSRGMLAAGIEIFMGRCFMISRHLLQTQGSETPCSSYNDTI